MNRVSSPIAVLYDSALDELVKFLRGRFGAGPPEPDEVAQKAFARLLERDTLPDNLGEARALLWRTASNVAISEYRAIQVRREHGSRVSLMQNQTEGYLFSPERVVLAKEQLERVVDALELMPNQRRRVFVLVRIEGLTHNEAAKRLGISRPAVSKHMALAATDLYSAAQEQN
ncbi:MAG: sigma-70 family RNA polymerase sigma factor [Pseudomonadota bacterium]